MAHAESSMEVEDCSDADQHFSQSVDLSQFSGTFNLEDYEVTTMDLGQAMQFFGDDMGLGSDSAQHNSHVDSFLDECERVGGFLKCPFNNCSYQTNIRNNMKSHFRYVHGEKKYKCNHCDYQSASRRNVTRHEQVHVKALLEAAFNGNESNIHLLPLPGPSQQHQLQQQSFAATPTQGMTASKLFLNQRAAKRASQLVQSPTAGNSTSTVSSTTMVPKPVTVVSTPTLAALFPSSFEIPEVPRPQQEEREPTPEPEDSSTSQTSFGRTSDSYFKCKLCPMTYSRSYDLHLHIRGAHKGFNAYACGQCLECFRTLSELTEHMKEDHEVSHAGHYLHPCEICDAKCLTPAVYQEHMKTYHRSALIRQCKLCSFKATTNAALNHHMATEHAAAARPATSKKLYACSKCLFRSQDRDAVSRHIKSVHKKNVIPPPAPPAEPEQDESPGPSPPKKRKYKCTRCGFIASTLEDFKVHSKRCKNSIDRLLKDGVKSITVHNTTITLVTPESSPRKNLELNGRCEDQEEMTTKPLTTAHNPATTFKLALQDCTKFEDEVGDGENADPYSLLNLEFDREHEVDASTYGDPLADYDDLQDDEEATSPSRNDNGLNSPKSAKSSTSVPLSVRHVLASLTDTLEDVANSEIVVQDDQGTHPYKCQFCHFDTGNIIRLFHHMMKHTGKQFFKCGCSSCRVGGHCKPVSPEEPKLNGVTEEENHEDKI